MGFGLEIGFTELLENLTTSNYSAKDNSHKHCSSLQHVRNLLSLLFLPQLSHGNGSNAVASSTSVFTSLLAGDSHN
jgi:hypothetical protein